MRHKQRELMAAALAAALLLAACDTADTSDSSEITTTTTTTETTAEITEIDAGTSVKPHLLDNTMNLSFDEVTDAVLDSMGSDYYVFPEYDPSSGDYLEPGNYVEKNLDFGILNVIVLGKSTMDIGNKDDEFNCEIVNVYIFEFDTDSSTYKKLHNGSKVFWYGPYGLKQVSTINAINNQYAIAVSTGRGKDGLFELEDMVYEPPYTIGRAQNAYEAFVALK